MRTNSSRSGFTLVEVMVVAPIIILFIGAFVGLVVNLTGESLRLRESNSAAYNVQDAIDEMQATADGAISFLTTTGTLQTPQGKNSDTTAFTNTTSGQPDTLIIKAPATTKNPIDPASGAVYSGTGACNSQNPVYPYMVVYMVVNKSLYKRTILQQSAACQTPWQLNSCNKSDKDSGSYSGICQVADEKLLDNVEALDIQYYISDTSTNPVGDSLAESAGAIAINITVAKPVSGESVSYSGSARVSSSNMKLGTAQASSPAGTITPSSDSTNAHISNFTWTKAGNAISYSVKYRPDASTAWNTATINVTNPNQATYTYSTTTLGRKQTAQVEVTVNTSSGSYLYGTASQVIPRWTACQLQNGWANYANGYVPAGFTRTTTGIVGLRGLIRSGSVGNDTVICQLPVGFRPAARITYPVMSVNAAQTAEGLGRIDIDEQGRVMASGVSSVWASLDSIMFPAAGASGVTLSSGVWENSGPNWQWWGNESGLRNYNTGQYYKDSLGRAYLYGVGRPLNGNSFLNGYNIMYTSGSFAPRDGYLLAVGSPVTYYIHTNGYVYGRGYSSSYLGLALVYMTTSGSAMTPLTMYNGWQNYPAPWAGTSCNKGSDDIVLLQGMMRYGASNGVAAAQLNAQGCGVMADGRQLFLGSSASSSVAGNPDTPVRLDIDASGALIPMTTDGTYWTSLVNIRYIAD